MRRLLSMFRSQKLDAQFNDELQFHREMLVESM